MGCHRESKTKQQQNTSAHQYEKTKNKSAKSDDSRNSNYLRKHLIVGQEF